MTQFRRRRLFGLIIGAAWLSATTPVAAQEPYRLPPQEIVDILDAPPPPAVSLDPQRRTMLLLHRQSMPPVADLAQPMLRLAGSRINPHTNGPHQPRVYVGITIKRIDEGRETDVSLPEDANVGRLSWSPDGSRFAFTMTREHGVELWVAEAATGRASALTEANVNAVSSSVFQWLPDSRHLLVSFVPDQRGEPPERAPAPAGLVVQETHGRTAPVRTYQDLLEDAHEEALYDYYFTAQLALLDVETGQRRDVGEPAVFGGVSASPSGEYLLVTRRVRPYSYLVPAWAFPEVVEVWNRSGEPAAHIAVLPLRDDTPIQGVPVGPRNFTWRNTAPATLLWVEALDGGDPRAEAPHRDRIMQLEAPFTGSAREVTRTEHRYAGLAWLDQGGLGMVNEFDRNRRWTRTWLYDFEDAECEPRLMWDRSIHDQYGHPGSPITTPLPSGDRAVLVYEGAIYLAGRGATPEGDRPFLDRMDLDGFETTRLWRCEGPRYEYVVDLLAADGSAVLTRQETPHDPPNYLLRDLAAGEHRRLTDFTDPAPQLRGIHRELVTYEREDGVPLSATLYLPADYQPGQRLPLVVWAYPREYSDSETAGQVSGSPHRFTFFSGSSHLFLLTQGYAIMDGAAMPVIGDVETMNDTFVEQIVAGAKAAIDYAAARGVADPERVGVGGHSYGAFMTANLLAHSSLFRAGVARSGAYNRTLTPFGFQSERRTLWEAPDAYFRLSPFMHAHGIRQPILLVHGQIDNNAGTFPMQSERLYHAIRGHGGTARLVILPYESHGYVARESVMHVLAEMVEWFDRHVKEAPPRSAAE